MLASNIANADTPGYHARDLDFRQTLLQASQPRPSTALHPIGSSHPNHLALNGASHAAQLVYATPSQPSMDGNSVDLDRERAQFVDNAVRYESTLRFINAQSKNLLSAIQGQ